MMKLFLVLLFVSFISSSLNAQNTSGSRTTVSRVATASHSISREKIQEKIEVLSAQIALEKNNANLYSARSREEFSNGFYDSAIADINKAIQLDTTKNTIFYEQRGFLKQQINSKTNQNRFSEKEILSDFNIAIALSKQNDKAQRYNSRALLYYKINRYNLAIADMDTAIFLSPFNSFFTRSYYTTRALYKDESKSYPLTETLKDYEKAIAVCNRDQKISPYLSRAKFFASKNMYTNAIADVDSALVYKENIKGGFCYRDRGDYKKQSKLYSDSSIQADYKMANTLDSLSRYGRH